MLNSEIFPFRWSRAAAAAAPNLPPSERSRSPTPARTASARSPTTSSSSSSSSSAPPPPSGPASSPGGGAASGASSRSSISHWPRSPTASAMPSPPMRCLSVASFAYGHNGSAYNRACLRLLQRFEAVETLMITLAYLREIDHYQYLMEEMTVLPDFTFLYLVVIANGHAFGASSFHALRICSGIRRLVLKLFVPRSSEAPTACPGCICDQPPIWRTEELLLNRLQDIEIQELRGSEHEVAFVK